MISRSIAVATALVSLAYANVNYSYGEISTYEEFKYGRFSTRIQGADKQSTVTGFFTIYGDTYKDRSKW